jgi:hypothetical protein
MSNHREHLRFNDPTMTVMNFISKMADGNIGATTLLTQIMRREDGLMILLSLDASHLYGHHIWEVFKDVCGGDIERFLYHIDMELPCQICGEVLITGPYSIMNEEKIRAHFEARRFWKPGSYWALENPPADPNYSYPIGREELTLLVNIEVAT